MGFFDFFKSEQKWNGYNEPYDVRDVADCIMAQPCCRDITNKELCCILYWTQADFLVVLGRRCFDSQIKAYHNRLSIRELTENLTWFGNKRNIAPQDEPRIIEMVYKAKNNYSSGDEMMQAIRKQKPYLQAILNGSFVIDEADLKEYFDKWGTKEEYDRQVKIPKESTLETALYRLNINISPIRDGEFKSRLCRMYDAINNVLIAAKEKPAKEKDVRRLTEYYIPTMIKLLGKYSRLSESGRKTPEVEKALKGIEALPNEIIEVANAVYDDIMEENLIDINADISVLKQKAESDKAHKEFIIAKNGDPEKTQAILYIIWDTDGIKDINPNASEEQYAYICSTHRYYKKDSTTGCWNYCEDSKMSDVLGYRTVVVR